MHLILISAVLLGRLPLTVSGALLGLLAWHGFARNPVHAALLVVSGNGRFALPADGRFNLELHASTRIGAFWAELAFSDRPNSRFLLIRDQISEPNWRHLCLILREGL